MIQEIKYRGVTSSPSDYDCPDGDIAVMMNVTNETGSLVPVAPPETLFTLPDGKFVVHIHKSSDYCNYIVYDNTTLSYLAESNPTTIISVEAMEGVSQINSIGNTLIVLTSTGIYYFLWKQNKYVNLGQKPEQIYAESYLVTSLYTSNDIETEYGEFHIFDEFITKEEYDAINNQETAGISIHTDKRNGLSNKVFGIVNKMRAEINKKGLFHAPFFIRLAYRMYDGSHIMHTAPKLFCPINTGKPICMLSYEVDHVRPVFIMPASSFTLDIKIPEGWEDIITHIDICVTKQIQGYTDDIVIENISYISNDEAKAFSIGSLGNEVGRCNVLKNYGSSTRYGINKVHVSTTGTWNPSKGDDKPCFAFLNVNGVSSYFMMYKVAPVTGYKTEVPTISASAAIRLGLPVKETYKIYDLRSIYNEDWMYLYVDSSRSDYFYQAHSPHQDSHPNVSIPLKDIDDKNFYDLVSEQNVFYILDSIELKKYNAGEVVTISPKIKENDLAVITQKQVLKDDYRSGDLIISSLCTNYNSRLNVVANSIIPYKGDYIENYFDARGYDGHSLLHPSIITGIDIEIYENGTSHIVHSEYHEKDLSYITNDISYLTYLFYPNSNAIAIYVTNKLGKIYRFALKKHSFLEGAYVFNDFNSLEDIATLCTDIPDDAEKILYGNKIYTSEINNPFHFPAGGVNTVGTGDIIGICSAVKALSQGQFGQFPLYGFTTEGIWALEVSATGTYSAKQPITRDVCNNPKSITQIDTAVLFSSDRGIMMIRGSESICISEAINDMTFDMSKLPAYNDILQLAGFNTVHFEFISFLEYIKKCGMSYDYTNQRIVIFNKEYHYAYVFSLRSKTWSFITSDFSSAVNSYPDSYIMTTDNKLANISIADNGQLHDIPGLVVTRPIKFGSPDILKTIDTCIHRGVFPKGCVQTVLYGSRDLMNWFVISSSKNHYLRMMRGTPFKYFRFVIVTNFSSGHSLSGTSVSLDARMINKLR